MTQEKDMRTHREKQKRSIQRYKKLQDGHTVNRERESNTLNSEPFAHKPFNSARHDGEKKQLKEEDKFSGTFSSAG